MLIPLAFGDVKGPPEALMRSGRFPVAHLRYAGESGPLVSGLLEGLAAVHIDGHAGVILAGNAVQQSPPANFGPGLDATVAALYRQLRRDDLQVERHVRADGSRVAVVYLKSEAARSTVQAIRSWSLNLRAHSARQPWWRTLLSSIRIPPALEAPSPPYLAEALSNGYVAVIKEGNRDPLVAPATLEMLFSSPGDVAIAPARKRTVVWSRVVAALLGLTLSAGLVAVGSYHHALIPAPFLVAVATSRSNLPFPVVGEMLLVSVIADTFQGAAMRTGGQRLTVAALIGIAVTLTALMQVGVLGATSGAIGIVESAVRATLPSPALRRLIRLWRYFFIGAAAGLGVLGMTLLFFAMLVYLGEERALKHPVRLPPTVVPR